jgi:hypothetical protein
MVCLVRERGVIGGVTGRYRRWRNGGEYVEEIIGSM